MTDSDKSKIMHKRTELAHERTILAYFRTAASLILFGVAFLGFREGSTLFLYGGFTSITIGAIFLLVALASYRKHNKELKSTMKRMVPIENKE